jgi:RimJ/RimL family protein N-acetyltransferase
MNQEPTITSTRLILRPICLDDAEAIFNYRSDSITNRFQGWIPERIEDVNNFIINRISAVIDQNGTWFQFAITLKQNTELIGDIGLHFFDKENKQVELGITLNKDHHGKGYATEAILQTMHYIFFTLNKHRIIASVDPENKSSIRLVRRLHFRKEAHFKESIFCNGKWTDDLIFAFLKSEWNGLEPGKMIKQP